MDKIDFICNHSSKKNISESALIEAWKTKSRIVQALYKVVSIAPMYKLKRALSIFSLSRKMLQALVLHRAHRIVTIKTP